MFLFTVTTYPSKHQRENCYSEFKEEQAWYFGALIKNGQILMNDCNTIFQEDKFITYLLAPEQDSLDLRNANKYVNEFYIKLLTLCTQEPTIQLLGKSSDYEETCSCETPSWYMLYSYYTTNESPVVCGDCGKSVPLYRLPKILGEDEYYSVLGWQKAYKACNRLFLEGIAERVAYQRLSKPTSDLSKLGHEICTAFENATEKPFYYYLFRYYSSHKPVCPICSLPWKLEEDNKSFMDYSCDKCRLVADEVNFR
ncbi:DUF2310 family Zn-ribbon-containing protein [Clostridium sp. BNL1100]|uniref:DUF2310 family Zn-ribbon-containing protein n=1 Tax=Clostridium sp. BNL1100 TaxID=755731 RepID=UPI00024A7947|nr:DUF2310 family Zn-ribbon-containing protein [Clostridium sp. BNL1100]AEY66548.1 putative nucleic acid-binding protein containing Zn ribbon [Clostridium sp. BNL1100]